MIEIQKKSNCCGCQSCYNKCPKNAIEMIEDEKGFKYPRINEEKCINCGLCEKVCPIINNKQIKNTPKAYACINKDENIRMQSTSGGIFTLLATAIINKGGVVFGACFNNNFGVYHTYSETIKDLEKFRSSKYLQSDIGLSYQKAKEFLDKDRYVLFTGTPCQIEAFKIFLEKDYSKLYLQDIICHGVPSPLVWNKYKEYKEKSFNSKLSEMSFRSKKEEGWGRYHVDMKFENNETYSINHNDDVYMKAFLKHLSLRESCTDCKFKKNNRLSDITLADFWGIRNVIPDMNDEKGTSLVIVNSDKGKELMDEIAESMICKEVDFEKAISGNPSYNTVSKANENSDNFFRTINSKDFESSVRMYLPNDSIIKKMKKKIKQIIRKY